MSMSGQFMLVPICMQGFVVFVSAPECCDIEKAVVDAEKSCHS